MELEIILVWLCQPITSLRNEKLDLPSLIIDNTLVQLSAVKPKLWVPACKKVKCSDTWIMGCFTKFVPVIITNKPVTIVFVANLV